MMYLTRESPLSLYQGCLHPEAKLAPEEEGAESPIRRDTPWAEVPELETAAFVGQPRAIAAVQPRAVNGDIVARDRDQLVSPSATPTARAYPPSYLPAAATPGKQPRQTLERFQAAESA